jgi:hypothetical protein
MHYDSCESCGGIWVENATEEVAESMDYKEAETALVQFYKRFRSK